MATAIEPRPDSRPLTATREIEFLRLRSVAGLSELAGCWSSLDDRVASPMQSYAWTAACAETFGRSSGVELLVGIRGDRVVAAAPLIATGRAGGRRELLTYRQVYEPADLIYEDAHALAALSRRLCEAGRPLFCGRMFAAAPSVTALQNAAAGRGRVLVRPQAVTPWIALDEGWASPEEKLSSRRRSDLRRARRHAENAGAMRVQCHTPSPDEVDRLLDLAFDIERRSWKGTAGTALAAGPLGDFHRCYARRAAARKAFRVDLLYFGPHAVAMQLAAIHQNRYWVLKVGYDPEFQRASPGILLMVEAIKQAVADGLSSYELLGTKEPWIEVWTDLERACVSLRYYPLNWRGATALAGDAIGQVRRRLTRRQTCNR